MNIIVREITLDNEKYAMIPIELFNRFRDIICEEQEDFIDIEEIKNIAKSSKIYSSQELDNLLFNESPVKKFREFRNMSQEDLANSIGVTKDYIKKIESGSREGSKKVLKDIAKVLDIDISYFI